MSFSTGLGAKSPVSYAPVHIINLDIQDNHEEATLGAFLVCELCQMVGVSAQLGITSSIAQKIN